ncbi:MAG TPA: DUF6597 domain-containing transcriptional factor [Flavisolibacter sp.]|nr:DUF6597 domain-containing transcriptional factor [Flavisolibacter sp.]
MDARIYIPVKTQLSEYITSVWEVFGRKTINETILPQGVIEIVFNLADAMHGYFNSAAAVQAPLCFVQGMHTKVVHVSYTGQQHLFGVRLQPHMVKGLLGILPLELNNRLIDLTLIKPRFNTLWHQLNEASSFEERVKLIEHEFPVINDTSCARTQRLCNLFFSDDIENFGSPDSLSRQIFYSSRHLNRKTHSLFGMCAEELISYKKFLHAVKMMHVEKSSLTTIAYRSGFYDQSHFCRIFKTYAGITAKQYGAGKSELPFHLFS